MKKQIIIVIILAVLCNLAIAGYAAGDGLTIEDVPAVSGEIVYLKLRLTDTMRGDALGVTFTYDAEYLDLVEDQCSWAKQGVLQDFDGRKNAGVWADSKQTDFTGEICTLAFRVVTSKEHFDTVVSCTLIVKNGAEEAGTVRADARVFSQCDHSFREWMNAGGNGHTRTCRHCGREETEAHRWDAGVTQADPNRPGVEVTVFTCGQCGATRSQEHEAGQKPTNPTVPEQTQPIQPTRPTNPENNDTTPKPTSPSNNNSSNQGDDHGHDHDTGVYLDKADWFVLAAVVGAVAVLIGMAVFVVKKKR